MLLLLALAGLAAPASGVTTAERVEARKLDAYDACLGSALATTACNNVATEPILKKYTAVFVNANSACGTAKQRLRFAMQFISTGDIFGGKPEAISAACKAQVLKCGANLHGATKLTPAARAAIRLLDQYDACIATALPKSCPKEVYPLKYKAVFVGKSAGCGAKAAACILPQQFCLKTATTESCVNYPEPLSASCQSALRVACRTAPPTAYAAFPAFKAPRTTPTKPTKPKDKYVRRKAAKPLPLFPPPEATVPTLAPVALQKGTTKRVTSCTNALDGKIISSCKGYCRPVQDPTTKQYTFFCVCNYDQTGDAPLSQQWVGPLGSKALDPSRAPRATRHGTALLGLYYTLGFSECQTYCQSFNSEHTSITHDACGSIVYSSGICALYAYKPIGACSAWLVDSSSSSVAYIQPKYTGKFNLCH